MNPPNASRIGRVSMLALLLACGAEAAGPGGGEAAGPGGNEPELGGQSGGEGGSWGGCSQTQQPFETAVDEGGQRYADTGREFEALLTGRLLLQWVPNGPAWIPLTLVHVTDVRFGEQVVGGCSSQFTVEVAFRLRSDEGGLAASFAGTLTATTYSGGKLTAALTDGSASDGSVPVGIATDAATSFEITWQKDWGLPRLRGFLATTEGAVKFASLDNQDPGDIESPLTRFPTHEIEAASLPALQRDACAAVQPTAPVMFDSDAALVQAVAKRWVLCSGTSTQAPGIAGLEVDSAGHYHELRVVDDALVAVQGFGHEGPRLLRAAAAISGSLPSWQDIAHLTRTELSADGSTLRVVGYTYGGRDIDVTLQATALPIRYPEPPYAKDTRAGLAACATGEADLGTALTSIDELRERLVGRWMFCRGRFGFPAEYKGIAFAANGSFQFLDANGDVLPTSMGALEIVSSPEQFLLRAGDARSEIFRPIFSRTPVKMSAGDEFDTVLSAL